MTDMALELLRDLVFVEEACVAGQTEQLIDSMGRAQVELDMTPEVKNQIAEVPVSALLLWYCLPLCATV